MLAFIYLASRASGESNSTSTSSIEIISTTLNSLTASSTFISTASSTPNAVKSLSSVVTTKTISMSSSTIATAAASIGTMPVGTPLNSYSRTATVDANVNPPMPTVFITATDISSKTIFVRNDLTQTSTIPVTIASSTRPIVVVVTDTLSFTSKPSAMPSADISAFAAIEVPQKRITNDNPEVVPLKDGTAIGSSPLAGQEHQSRDNGQSPSVIFGVSFGAAFILIGGFVGGYLVWRKRNQSSNTKLVIPAIRKNSMSFNSEKPPALAPVREQTTGFLSPRNFYDGLPALSSVASDRGADSLLFESDPPVKQVLPHSAIDIDHCPIPIPVEISQLSQDEVDRRASTFTVQSAFHNVPHDQQIRESFIVNARPSSILCSPREVRAFSLPTPNGLNMIDAAYAVAAAASQAASQESAKYDGKYDSMDSFDDLESDYGCNYRYSGFTDKTDVTE